jgi:hypothetical protein
MGGIAIFRPTIFLRGCGRVRLAFHPLEALDAAVITDEVSVCNALRSPTRISHPGDGADVVKHFVKAGGAKERFHLRDETVVGFTGKRRLCA